MNFKSKQSSSEEVKLSSVKLSNSLLQTTPSEIRELISNQRKLANLLTTLVMMAEDREYEDEFFQRIISGLRHYLHSQSTLISSMYTLKTGCSARVDDGGFIFTYLDGGSITDDNE